MIKIVWIVNIIMPFPAEFFKFNTNCFGGWLIGSLEQFRENNEYELAIVSVYSGNEIKKVSDKNITYYLIPNNSKLKQSCQSILTEFKPDIIHLHGSEYTHTSKIIECETNAKIVLSLQGIVSVIGRKYLSGLTNKEIISTITVRDIIKKDTIFNQKRKFIERGIKEIEIFKKVHAVIGRTLWDKSVTYSIDNELPYYHNNESLRESFYKSKWNITNIKRYRIYISQGSYTIKGFHVFLDALNIVKKIYPDVEVIVAGENIIDRGIKISGYGKLLLKKMKTYDTIKNVKFLGLQTEEQTVKNMLSSHITIVPSYIENSSNSLGEAMLLGVPSIAAYTGGTPSMIRDGYDGYLYSYSDYEVLAFKIISLFNDDELCKNISINSIKTATERHDKSKNFFELTKIYEKIINNE